MCEEQQSEGEGAEQKPVKGVREVEGPRVGGGGCRAPHGGPGAPLHLVHGRRASHRQNSEIKKGLLMILF